MGTRTSNANWKAKFLLYGGVGLVLLMALMQLAAVFGPALVIWQVARPRGVGLSFLPRAFQLYIGEIAAQNGISTTRVYASYSITVVVCGILIVLGVMTAGVKRRSRLLLLTTLLLLTLWQVVLIALARFSLVQTIDQATWVIYYCLIVLMLTRKPVRQLFANQTSSDSERDRTPLLATVPRTEN